MTDRSQLLNALRIERTPTSSTEQKKWWWLLVVALIFGGAIAWLMTRETRPLVHVARATVVNTAARASVLDASGYVTARRMATVSAKITGKIKEVMIEEGQYVKAGQIMATLDPVDAVAQRRLVQSQQAAMRSQLRSLQTQLKQAEADATRYQELHKRQLVASAQAEQAALHRDTLQAQLDTAQRNVQVVDEQMRIAELGVDNTVVRAPFSGVITAKAAQPGEIVSPFSAGGGFTRTGIGTLVDMDSLEIEVDVNESYIGRVQAKMPVVAVLDAYPDWKIPAAVIAIIPAANRSKATVKVRIALQQKDPRIVPDMGVKVSFHEAAAPETAPVSGVSIPAAAIATRDAHTIAFVVDADGKIERRALSLGTDIGNDKLVLAGLSAGETVVLEPRIELQDGMQVRIATQDK